MRHFYLPISVILALTLLLSQGCTDDVGPFYVPPPIDTLNGFDTVSFANAVMPILIERCWVCHPPSGGLNLGPGAAYQSLVNVTSTGHAPMKRVVPYDPMASLLWQKIIYSGDYGLPMPPNTTLPNEELVTIRSWIEQGAMDN